MDSPECVDRFGDKRPRAGSVDSQLGQCGEGTRVQLDLAGLSDCHLCGNQLDEYPFIIEDPEAFNWPHTPTRCLRDDPETDARQGSHLEKMAELTSHHLGICDLGPKHRLFKKDRKGVVALAKYSLAVDPSSYRGLGVIGNLLEGDDRTHKRGGIGHRLQEPWDDAWFIDAEVSRSLVERHGSLLDLTKARAGLASPLHVHAFNTTSCGDEILGLLGHATVQGPGPDVGVGGGRLAASDP